MFVNKYFYVEVEICVLFGEFVDVLVDFLGNVDFFVIGMKKYLILGWIVGGVSCVIMVYV